MLTLSTDGITSIWSGVATANLNSAVASPPVLLTTHLYVPASSAVTASMANIGPNRRTRELVNTGNGSFDPLKVYQLMKWE